MNVKLDNKMFWTKIKIRRNINECNGIGHIHYLDKNKIGP